VLMRDQDAEIELLGATIYLHKVEPRIQAISDLNRFSTEPDIAHRMLWNHQNSRSVWGEVPTRLYQDYQTPRPTGSTRDVG
jgi:hypothetical protein